ncbi:MAG TPA: DUF4062 domain-containing protein [Thermoanaerobaculia bacterium]|nr:DUF4062 domain-containing protein [Thermoanaerobaculia bacterium]
MTIDNKPAVFKGVMVSSTFTDLREHRDALILAIDGQELKPVGMDRDSAAPVDVLASSLLKVRKAAAYIGVISHKYGQIPEDAQRNPSSLSLTELEFDEAIHLGRPVLLFIMGPKHPVPADEVETDPDKKRKLDAFRERAKRFDAGSGVERVYRVFNDLHEFQLAALPAIAELRRYLEAQDAATPEPAAERERDFIPTAPALYAEPPYIGSHRFVGRQAQLETLSDWAAAADPHPVLLFEAIGGAGKSMLTWEWTTRHATDARTDWAGRFWYSFYEKGAVMADFCRRALAYTTRRPLADFRKRKTSELSELLLQQLRQRPWLLVLDGLERVLVAYHRIDAAHLADEVAGSSDEIAGRDPCAAIRPEDDDLLRALASAAPSKLLLTSRLIPRVLLNSSSQPIPGILHERLPGLRPADAEALLRSCGVTGETQAIQSYLKSHCDCHALVTGVLAGLINNYLPGRGDFDVWASARDGGAALNLASLDLAQKRNHILRAALEALSEPSRQLLSTLALLSEAVDYSTLSAIIPQLPHQLATTVRDLESRGLLQYDLQARRYDLHPVVRGIAAGNLQQEERLTYGKRVVDYFSQQSHGAYDQAETFDDLRNGVHVVRTFLQMGQYQEAFSAYRGALSNALTFNLEAHTSILALIQPFFPNGWGSLPEDLDTPSACYLANEAGLSLKALGDTATALSAYGAALGGNLRIRKWKNVRVQLSNIASVLHTEGRIAAAARYGALALELAIAAEETQGLFLARLHRLYDLALRGDWSDAEEVWKGLDPAAHQWNRATYRPGKAELYYARLRFWYGDLREEHLVHAEALAKEAKDRATIRVIHRLRGEWLIEQRKWALAANSLNEAVRMAREVEQRDAGAETQLALANFHLGRLVDPSSEAAYLSSRPYVEDGPLAALWHAIGNCEQAKKHALAAYEWAWADGEPYVRRYAFVKARALLEELRADIPDLPPYDPAKDVNFPWEEEVASAIEQLKAEKAQQ